MTESLVTNERTRRGTKSAAAFRTISEVATDLSVPSHVLRFWETKFSQVRPLKRGGGRRYYRPEDIALLRSIRSLLYDDGYTIKGVQKLLREGGANSPSLDAAVPKSKRVSQEIKSASVEEADGAKTGTSLSPTARGALSDLLRELEELRDILKKSQ
jgi:DNA-binding transcriptional MerR regulator